ncbi:TIM barrel protein [Vibrio sp. PP-XX7]
MLSISNIAWDISVDADVVQLLHQYDVTSIDIAPSKYFAQPTLVLEHAFEQVKQYWHSQGIVLLGMQSLLFGTQGFNLFGRREVRQQMLQHLRSLCRIGNVLGARKLVFGSPKNRDRAHLNDADTQRIATEFFNQLGDIAQEQQVVICLEPSPVCYHSNFMVNTLETAAVVLTVNHPHIRMQLDVGAMCLNQEDARAVIVQVAPLVHHIHISEPQLVPLNSGNTYHEQASQAIRCYLPDHPVTIEMLTSSPAHALFEIEQAIQLVQNVYQRRL